MKAKWILPLMIATATASGAALAADTALAAEPGGMEYVGPKRSVFNRSPLDQTGTGGLAGTAAAEVEYLGPKRSVFNRAPLDVRDGDTTPQAASVAKVEYLGPKRSLFNLNPNVPLERSEFAPFEKASRR